MSHSRPGATQSLASGLLVDRTRPKSSKRLSRPALNNPPCVRDADDIQRPPAGDFRPGPDLDKDGALQHAPTAPPQPLNKYTVLPSIERRRSVGRAGMAAAPGGGRGSEDHLMDPHKPPDPGPEKADCSSADPAGSLLLAIRAPCGSRFEQRFHPADSLRALRVSAEARYGAQYGEVSIQAVDLPRRSFTDLDMTLAQCGILNRSLLCISPRDS
ncbi:UBX domain-containing protein 10 [Aulostomus maculatus]